MAVPRPTSLKLQPGSRLLITWDDGSQDLLALAVLRRRCPCAVCVTEREQQSPSYLPLFNPDQVTLKTVSPVGTYALSFTWLDGHNTGIYEFPFLKAVCAGGAA